MAAAVVDALVKLVLELIGSITQAAEVVTVEIEVLPMEETLAGDLDEEMESRFTPKDVNSKGRSASLPEEALPMEVHLEVTGATAPTVD